MMLRVVAIFFFILVLFVGVAFSSLNSDPVVVHYYLGSAELPLSVVVVSAFAVGVLCAFLVSLNVFLGSRWRLSRLRRDVRAREQEISLLRNPRA
jgi:uncharacterized membrane protein YciS (DUF1049 family)